MKRNGFIATSILYSFFLIFITLFVALVMNYLHNQVLISKIDEEAWDFLSEMKSKKMTDLEVGDYVKFRMAENVKLADGDELPVLLNEDSSWILAYVEESGTKKTLYFLSDLDTHEDYIYIKLDGDMIPKYRPATINLYNGLKSRMVNGVSVNLYNKQVEFNQGGNENRLDIGVVNATLLKKIRNQKDKQGNPLDVNILNAIYNVGGSYVVYIDEASINEGVTATTPYEVETFYENRAYSFLLGEQHADQFKSYCGITYDGTNIQYIANNPFGYANLVKQTITNGRYVDYCWYASPVGYEHKVDEYVVTEYEKAASDKILSHTSVLYTLRMMATTTLDVNATNTYLNGGKGLKDDPYIITDGGQRS